MGRNVGRSEDSVEREQFLQEKLHVPRPWIAEAKAVYASTVGNYGDQAWYLIQVIYIFFTFTVWCKVLYLSENKFIVTSFGFYVFY